MSKVIPNPPESLRRNTRQLCATQRWALGPSELGHAECSTVPQMRNPEPRRLIVLWCRSRSEGTEHYGQGVANRSRVPHNP